MNLEFNTHACDRCFVRKQKCSRHLPNCLKCQAANTTCGYNKAKFRNRKLPSTDMSHYPFVPEQIWTIKKAGEPLTKEIFLKKSKFPSYDGGIYKIHQFLSKNSLFMSLIDMTNVPLSPKILNNRETVAKLSKLVTLLEAPTPKVLVSPVNVKMVINYEKMDLYHEAVDAYFRLHNPFLPLFTRESYFTLNRPRVIKLVIFAAGLKLLGIDSTQFKHLTKLHDEIASLVKANLTKPSLSMVQVLILGSTFLLTIPYFATIMVMARFLAGRMGSILGLDLALSYTNPLVNLERQLAQINLVHNNLIYCLGCSREILFYRNEPLNISMSSFNRLSSKVILHYNNYRREHNANLFLENSAIVQFTLVTIHQIPLLRQVVLLKIRISEASISNEKFLSEAINLCSTIKCWLSADLQSLYNLKLKLNPALETYELIDKLILAVKLTYNSALIQLYYMFRYMGTSPNSIISKFPLPKPTDIYLKAQVDIAKTTIIYAHAFGFKFCYNNLLFFINLPLLTLVKFRPLYPTPTDLDSSIETGFKMLAFGSKYKAINCFSSLVRLVSQQNELEQKHKSET